MPRLLTLLLLVSLRGLLLLLVILLFPILRLGLVQQLLSSLGRGIRFVICALVIVFVIVFLVLLAILAALALLLGDAGLDSLLLLVLLHLCTFLCLLKGFHCWCALGHKCILVSLGEDLAEVCVEVHAVGRLYVQSLSDAIGDMLQELVGGAGQQSLQVSYLHDALVDGDEEELQFIDELPFQAVRLQAGDRLTKAFLQKDLSDEAVKRIAFDLHQLRRPEKEAAFREDVEGVDHCSGCRREVL
mmetsp:Transcript_46041/g.85915  ORF Transcript_46041/g.85915 Transcript_46041/m.85915 type:complete len:244 (-) Transcript_46041:95-826(-)